MSESLNEKIKKLLRLAERAGTPQEAETASRMAERLILKWGIDEANLRATMGDEQTPEAIVTKDTAPFPKAFVKPRTAVAGSVVRGMGNMRTWNQGQWDGTMVVKIMGFESDVDRALTLIPSILLQADHGCAQWWKSYPLRTTMSAAESKRAKRNFLFGFGNEVKDRLTRMRAEEVVAAGEMSTAIVLRDRDAAVEEEYQAQIAGSLRRSKKLKGSFHGGDAGREAGKRANLGGTSLGSSARGVLG